MTGRGIRLGPDPTIPEPERCAFVLALRDVLRDSRFGALNELGGALRPRRTKQRLSELARGQRLPDPAEPKAVVGACRPSALSELQRLLGRAVAEKSALAAGRAQHAFRLGDHAVAVGGRLPIVEQYRDWARLGVHPRSPCCRRDRTSPRGCGPASCPAMWSGRRTAASCARPWPRPPPAKIHRCGWCWSPEHRWPGRRAAVEAMRAELPTWRLLIPRSADALATLHGAGFDLRHTVVGLNEIQEVLEQDRGVEQLDRLLDRTIGQTVLLATLRADAEDALPGTAARRLLGRAIPRVTLQRRPRREEFERELARARESDDPWLAEALTKIGDRSGIAEWLAAGPQLADELERARASDDPVKQSAAALVDAAIDCYRAGYT